MRLRPIPKLAAAFATIGLTMSVGCQKSTDRLPVSGTVTLDGTPLSEGMIRFSSTGGNLVASGAVIRDGGYTIEAEKGLPPGTYRLEISSPDNDAKPVLFRSSPSDPGLPMQPDRIPAEYNVESKHTVDVTVDGDNHFEFAIASRPAK
jgi:hypothetical protein